MITIHDNGIGMTKNQIKEIKSQGMMRSIPGTANETGSGMGIYICQYIIDAHKGSIQFKSKKGKGTEVEIILPSK
jgi:signal transduction histidine kinase